MQPTECIDIIQLSFCHPVGVGFEHMCMINAMSDRLSFISDLGISDLLPASLKQWQTYLTA
jgi:hypothetical protein